MLRHTLTLLFVFSLAIVCQAQTPEYYPTKQSSLRPLLEVLNKAGVSGSLEFTGSCPSPVHTFSNFPEFPELRKAASSQGSVLKTVREMFADDPAMQVTQDPDGTVRMVERGVATDILNIWIEHIPFASGQPPEPRPIYSANAAITHVLATPEVQRFMKSQDIQQLGGIVSVACCTPPSLTSPHVTGPLDNLTLSQAMDYILKSFPGIWWYQNCPATDKRTREVYFEFYDLKNIGVGVRAVQ
ncbi:MAG: hypothetical protein WCC87_21735 [Candidatus Korobacteraceae bacterium]